MSYSRQEFWDDMRKIKDLDQAVVFASSNPRTEWQGRLLVVQLLAALGSEDGSYDVTHLMDAFLSCIRDYHGIDDEGSIDVKIGNYGWSYKDGGVE